MKTPEPESFFNKVAGPMPASLLKKRLWHRYFPVNFVKFLRTSFLTEHLWWLLLKLELLIWNYCGQHKLPFHYNKTSKTMWERERREERGELFQELAKRGGSFWNNVDLSILSSPDLNWNLLSFLPAPSYFNLEHY